MTAYTMSAANPGTERQTPAEFLNAMRLAGLSPPSVMTPGQLHHLPKTSRTHGEPSGWCLLFPGEAGGCYGDWRSDQHDIWTPDRNTSLPPDARSQLARQIFSAVARREATRSISASTPENQGRCSGTDDNSDNSGTEKSS